MVDVVENCLNGRLEVMSVDELKVDDGWMVVLSRKNKGKRN